MRIPLRCAWGAAAAWLLVTATAHAQGDLPHPLSLTQARDSARRHSPELKAARSGVQGAAGRERQAAAWPNPTLGYGREQASREGESNAQDILSLEQPFELGGQRAARRAAARSAREAAEAREAAGAARLDYEVVRAYAGAVAAGRRAALAAAAADAFERAAAVSRTRLAGGDVSGYQHRRLTLETARYAALEAEARVVRDSAIGLVASLTGVADGPGSLVLTDTLPLGPLPLAADSLAALALARSPDLRAAVLEVEVAAAESRLSRAERVPTPVLMGGYKHERTTAGGSLGGFVAGVSLPLPLWDRRGGAVEAARAATEQREAEVEALRRNTAREVRAAFGAHQALAEQLEALRSALGDEALRARRAAESAYAEGEIGLLEWLDSVRAYQEAETTFATLQAEYIARRAALERATGATLF
jgi:cobalt-zinc-cadmium efflux system outer membrane protein